ncbi:MAG: DUF4388 domain-containing protein [Acidobacteriota bacterium]
MGITGNLKTMELSELLQWLSQGRKTGTLYVDNGEVEKRIFFNEGTIVSSAASDPKEYLGHFLVSHGFIDELTLAKAMEMQEENKMLLGKILLTIGAISEEDLNRMLQLKAEESIYQLFTWGEAEFRFADDELPHYHMVKLALGVTGLVLEGHRRVDEWNQIRRKIPSLSCVPVAVAKLEPPESDPGEANILAMVDDDHTVGEIVLQTHSSEFQVCRVLYHQIRQGKLKIVRPRQIREEISVVSPAGRDTVEPEAILEVAQRHLESRRFEQALRHLHAARSLDPNSAKVQQLVTAAERSIQQAIREDGIHLTSIPVVSAATTDVDALKLSPQEEFIFARVNGSYDIQTILKITPVPPLEAQVIFWNLQEVGHIELKAPSKTKQEADF